MEPILSKPSAQPFLKWAGGKRWLTKSNIDFENIEFETYIEPFLGSGAMFFHLQPNKSVLSDVNRRLIQTYQAIRDDYITVVGELRKHAKRHSKDYYYAERNRNRRSPHTQAAQFVYLNRVCFNGIYRENKLGRFNVPLGSKQNVILPNDDFKAVAKSLQNADLLSCDFEDTISLAGQNDLLFVDPPYTTAHNKNGFVKYNQKLFSWDDQVRLERCLRSARDRGANVIITNAAHSSVLDLYSSWNVHELDRRSVISATKMGRGMTSEFLITSFPDEFFAEIWNEK